MDRPPWAPDEVDIAAPSVARVYDYFLGGSHNVASDRAFGQAVVAVFPAAPAIARQNRGFLRRTVQYLVAAGVDRFLDLGSGIPMVGNLRSDGEPTAMAGQRLYARERSLHALWTGSPREIAALFGGLRLVAPGLVPVPAWRPCLAEAGEVGDGHPLLGGLGRRD